MEPRPNTPAPGKELPLWLWLVFPPLIVPAQVLLKARSESAYRTWMRGEIGIVELGTVVFLLVAVVTGVALLLTVPKARRAPHFLPWIALGTLGCLYFGGEEASWGQHYFGWSTPEGWAELNRQQETNLHNTIGLLDQAPRLVLGLGALVGGILMPLWFLSRERASRLARHPLAWVVPTVVVLPSAVLSLGVTLPKSIFKLFGRPLPEALEFSAGETKEYAFGLFLMLYLLSLWRRREALTERLVPRELPAPAGSRARAEPARRP